MRSKLNPPPFYRNVLLVVFLFVISFCQSQNQSNYNLLWKIEGKNLTKPSYLFGTMHVDDERAFNFSDAVMPAIEEVDMFALEVNPDSLMLAMTSKVVEQDPKDVFKSILSDDEYQLLVDRFEEINDFSFEESGLRDPNTILALLIPDTENENDKSTFVDLYLYNQARTMQKSITGLEDMYDQLNYFENLSPENQRLYVLEQIEDNLDDMNRELEKLTELYYQGNIQAIDSMIRTYDGYDMELTKRNQVMVKSIMDITKNNSLFSAVGAAHLPGDNGIISLLKKEGYQVTPVEAQFTGIADTYVIDESKMPWYTFNDELLGYSIDIPNEPNFNEEFPGFTIHMYQGLQDDIFYLFSGLNLTFQNDDVDYHKLIGRFINTVTTSYSGKLLDLEEVSVSEGIKYIAKIDMEENNIMLFHIMVKNKMMYFQGAQTNAKDIESNTSIKRFFNSLQTTEPKPVQETSWVEHHDKVGAFSINIPGEPQNMSREYPNPHEEDGEPYQLSMFLVTDYDSGSNYIIRYNDHPIGYFMDNFQDGFDEIKSSFETKASIIGEEKTIYLDGYEGREYELLLQEKYHTICRVYYRGNRMYLLMNQKLNETDKVNTDNPFFNSFKFEAYDTPNTLITLKPKGTNFEFQFFEKNRLIVDSVDYDDTYIKNSNDYYTKNPKSGGVYQFGYSDLQDYFKITTKKEFYDTHKDYLSGWNDTIVKQETLKIDDNEVLEFYVMNKTTQIKTRYRFWLHDKYFFMLSAHVGAEELNNAITDSIFNSFKTTKPNNKPFDVFASKTHVILKDLKSTDSTTYKRALGALSYYDFEESDLKSLHKTMAITYPDSLKNSQIKNHLAAIFENLNNENTLQVLKTAYQELDASDDLKSNILVVLPDLPNENALETYNELLFNNPPKSSDSYNWSTLSPFKDSLAYSTENFNKLLTLMPYTKFRRDIINISTRILEDSIQDNQVVIQGFKPLTEYVMEDLSAYLKNSETEEYDYTYSSLMYGYSGLFSEMETTEKIMNDFTQKIITDDSNEWLIADAITFRIERQLPVADTLTNAYLENQNHRIEIIKALHKAQRLEEVPETYLDLKSISESVLYNYTSEDYTAENINYLGTITEDNKDYFIYSFNHETEENEETENYIGIVGPIIPISQNEPLVFPEAYSNWDTLEDDWRTQGIKLIPDLEEYGY